MQVYNYREALKADICEYLEENYSHELKEEIAEYSRDEFEEKLYDELWTADSVTGNASGSYTFNTFKAAECLCHNWELLAEAMEEFGCDMKAAEMLDKGEEYCDVTIRCYLMPQALHEILDEWWK